MRRGDRASARLRARVLAFATAAALLALSSPAAAERPLDIGFSDHVYGGSSRGHWLDLTKQVHADIIRVNLYWSLVAYNEPANARDPEDPQYDWGRIDREIEAAKERGFEVELTVLAAPLWAEGPKRPVSREVAPPGSWRPDPAAYGDFAHAVATRYSGDYESGGRTLPAIDYFEAWNEPNLSSFLSPQFSGKRNVSAEIYVRLLNSAYEEVKAVSPNLPVITGGTAPYGDPPSNKAMKTSPLAFYRELLCLNGRLRRARCPAGQQPKFDIVAHHPINRADPPTAHAERRDDVEIADFGELRKVVRRAEKLGTTATDGRHPLWANEIWWQTNPPDRGEGVSYRTHARWTQHGLYLLWKQGASNVTFLQFRDAKHRRDEYTLDTYQTGVYTFTGQRKPTATAVAFPFVTDRKGKRSLLAWGRAPRSGKVTIEARRGGGKFRKVTTVRAKEGEVFTKRLGLSGKLDLRARVGGRKSLVWSQR